MIWLKERKKLRVSAPQARAAGRARDMSSTRSLCATRRRFQSWIIPPSERKA